MQHEADRVLIEADRIGPYAPVPNLIRIAKDDQARYLHPAWDERIDDQSMVAIREHAERLELPISGPSAESGEQIRSAMARIPTPRTPARLNEAQLRQLPALFAAGPLAYGFAGRLWDEGSTAQLLERIFGLELDTKEAELSALGRKLAGVDPW